MAHIRPCESRCADKMVTGQGKIWTEYAMLISSQQSSIYFPRLRVWSRVQFWNWKGQDTKKESLCKMNIWIHCCPVFCAAIYSHEMRKMQIKQVTDYESLHSPDSEAAMLLYNVI